MKVSDKIIADASRTLVSMNVLKVFKVILSYTGNDRKFYSTRHNRQLISNELRISDSTVRNCIVKLVSSGMLVRISRGMYGINIL